MAFESEEGRAQRGVLFAKCCEKCGVRHGAAIDPEHPNKLALLTENTVNKKKVLLCQGCAFKLVLRLRSAPRGRKLKTPESKEPDLFAPASQVPAKKSRRK